MSSADFRRAGLHNLNVIEIEALNRWWAQWQRRGPLGRAHLRECPAPLLTDLNALLGAGVVAGDGHLLGVVAEKIKFKSILDSFGSTSLMNKHSIYGDATHALSPFNPDSNTPPALIKHGHVIGYLTANPNVVPRVDPGTLLGWLRRR